MENIAQCMAAYLVQTIVVVTRPLLFCCVKKFFEAPREVEPLISSRKIRQLLNMSLEASQKILSILESLQDQGLLGENLTVPSQLSTANRHLETFLPWDLDSLFVSTMVLILTRFVDASLLENQSAWLEKAYGFLEMMASSGNRIAAFRVIELRKLDEMLADYLLNQHRPSTASTMHNSGIGTQQINVGLTFPDGYHSTASLMTQDDSMPPPHTGLSDEGSGFGDDLTAEQILAVAESMDIEGTDWLSFATLDNYQMVDPHL
jgi:proline utilization trans-activator